MAPDLLVGKANTPYTFFIFGIWNLSVCEPDSLDFNLPFDLNWMFEYLLFLSIFSDISWFSCCSICATVMYLSMNKDTH
jgi:hypothetical protein